MQETQRGQSLVEYALVIVLVVVASLVIQGHLAPWIASFFTSGN